MSKTDGTAQYYFHQGTNFSSFDYLGCQESREGEKYVYRFRTWAPNADFVGLVSDFIGWDMPYEMHKISEKGVWECEYRSDISLFGNAYKFMIRRGDKTVLKGDPYAKFSRGGADGASLIYKDNYKWSDKAWLTWRKKSIRLDKCGYLNTPINIYEMHFSSFIRHGQDNSYYTYREMADILPSYLKYMGYTHVEFLPLTEYPYDGSWGYQVCGFFAPTSRFGTPEDLKHLIDKLHNAGIGVIMDWVPAHFPKDEWGLYEFDGGPLYEYQGIDRQNSRSWGTRFFDLGREEVQSFLISSAIYFLREFHIDGLRVDAVASMIYLDYDKEPGEWIPNSDGGRENKEGIAFLQKLNAAIFKEFADVLMIAEESGSFAGITQPVSLGGLGFSLKWNMGWANDFYDYLSTDPYYRKYKHKALNFPIMYAFDENYVMPISHDEVVHGKLSLIDKMYGSYEDKFSQMRAAMLLMMSYPGKKLTFMGCEFAQFREWDYENSLEWFMLDYPNHRAMREYVAALNRFYLENPPMWSLDFDRAGFSWILADEADKNTVLFKRFDSIGNSLTFCINLSGEAQTMTFGGGARLERVFDTGNVGDGFKILYDEMTQNTELTVPSFSGVVLKEIKAKIKIKI
ncbi:MAG: 1,4-alpha-glucan branching protein GlgB [Clostridia bacterium]|nr:1,4-alpha-glucan branching protein GlgB [Clostridia bacterium]